MVETQLIDGKQAAREIRISLKKKVRQLTEKGLPAPKLSVILVGENPASQTYVRNKVRACEKVGILSETILFPDTCTEEELLKKVRELNEDPGVNGILVQLPLPEQIMVPHVIEAIDPSKDVDGFHVLNVGKLSSSLGGGFVPCTPEGIMDLIHRTGRSLDGARCVVVGRSNLVGKPVALLALSENATVTICHSHTKHLEEITRQADVLIAAVGRPHTITGSMIKEGAVVIDVGINRTEEGLTGDVDTQSCMGIASYITPVPGGVGPMTIAMLLKNCLSAYYRQRQLEEGV